MEQQHQSINEDGKGESEKWSNAHTEQKEQLSKEPVIWDFLKAWCEGWMKENQTIMVWVGFPKLQNKRYLLPCQYSGSEWMFVWSAHSIEKWYLDKESTPMLWEALHKLSLAWS